MLAPRLAIVDLETTGMSARTDRVTEIAVLEGIPMTLIHRTPLAAAILVALGLRKIRLLSNSTRKAVGLDGYGLESVEHVPG